MARIENHKFTIAEAFSECFYIVPDYQREYVWTDKEVMQLLDDISEQMESGREKEYFIGTVIVSPTNKQKNHYEVIDGQQRLTTLFLLLCALRQLFKGEPQRQDLNNRILASYTDRDGETHENLKLEPRYEHAGEVIAKLVEVDDDPQAVRASIQAAGIESFGSLENLLNAYGAIHRHLTDNFDEPLKLRKYWGYLSNEVVFIQISTDVSSALKIFETINERGIGLNPMDLLKNLLFTQVRQEQFTHLKTEWEKVTEPLEKAREKPLRFLRYFLMANYTIENGRGDAVVREDEIYDWFVNQKNEKSCKYKEKPLEFVGMVARNVRHYLAFGQGRTSDNRQSIPMENLGRLSGGAFSLHTILLLAAAGFPQELFDHFITQLESFLFYYIFTKSPTKELERNFSAWADDLRDVSSNADTSKRSSALNKFITDRFNKNIEAKAPLLADTLKRYSLGSMQKYRTRYLLAKLTQYVDMAFSGLKTPGSLEPYLKLEIEHILPDTPTAELRAIWSAENTEADYDEYKNKLGNLTLLEKPINIVASNDFYEVKKAEYRKSSNYLTRSLVELTSVGNNTSVNRVNAKLAAFEKWDAKSIDARQNLLIELGNDIWKTALIDG